MVNSLPGPAVLEQATPISYVGKLRQAVIVIQRSRNLNVSCVGLMVQQRP